MGKWIVLKLLRIFQQTLVVIKQKINKKYFEKFRVKQRLLERNHLIGQGSKLCVFRQ
jgi:hypothetical protein